MSQDQKKSTVGDPIWVESLMTAAEHAECHKKYPTTVKSSKPVLFDPNYHLGGKWRAGMGSGYTAAEIIIINKQIDQLHELLKTKHFQRRPEYGTHAEAKP
jgi:hypothetical protein